ncbi:MAG: DUF2794 domain-containing protein [Telmatospirillum sp.]|nr:DUF2794 domain-containing protein [Telmatospirillum sp.]
MEEPHRSAAVAVRFERSELSRLLSLYSIRVSRGEWRDYAIDLGSGRAVFSIFRTALDRPIFTISKIVRQGRVACWEVAAGVKTVLRADTLDEALAAFDRRLRLVAALDQGPPLSGAGA